METVDETDITVKDYMSVLKNQNDQSFDDIMDMLDDVMVKRNKEKPITLSSKHWNMLNHLYKLYDLTVARSDEKHNEIIHIRRIMDDRVYYDRDKEFLNEQRVIYLKINNNKK